MSRGRRGNAERRVSSAFRLAPWIPLVLSLLPMALEARGTTDAPATAGLHPDGRSGSAVTFGLPAPLLRDEGATLDVEFLAGLVAPSTSAQGAAWDRSDPQRYVDAAAVALFVLVFYVLVWAAASRPPPRSPVIATYDPPEGISPAAAGYLDQRGFNERHLTASIFGLARNGVLEVEENGRGGWTVRRIGPLPSTLEPDERVVAETLLPADDALVITGISHSRIRATRRALRRELKRRLHGRYFVANREWFALGLLLSLAGLAVLASRTGIGVAPAAWVHAGSLLLWGALSWGILTRGYRQWRIDLAEMSPKPSLLAASVFPLLMTVPVGVFGLLAHRLYNTVPPHLFLAALLLCGINAVFFRILERPTVAGQELLSRVEGFKQFLAATEADRLDRLSTAESQELYHRLLPYAVALGMRNRWADAFGGAMKPIVSTEQGGG